MQLNQQLSYNVFVKCHEVTGCILEIAHHGFVKYFVFTLICRILHEKLIKFICELLSKGIMYAKLYPQKVFMCFIYFYFLKFNSQLLTGKKNCKLRQNILKIKKLPKKVKFFLLKNSFMLGYLSVVHSVGLINRMHRTQQLYKHKTTFGDNF